MATDLYGLRIAKGKLNTAKRGKTLSKHILLLFFLCLFVLSYTTVCFAVESNQNHDNSQKWLNPDEQVWLKEHPVIRIAPDPYFPPIESIDKNGTYHGIAADYMELLSEMLGVRFEVIRCKNWDDVLKKAKNCEVDVLPAAAQTPERKKYLKFSDSHIEFPGVIITREDARQIKNLSDIKAGEKLAVVKGYVWQEFIERDYPNINLLLVHDMVDGFRRIAVGEADAIVVTLPIAIHYIQEEGISNLHVTGKTGYFTRLSLAVRSDWPVLHHIFGKALLQISPEEHAEIMGNFGSLKEIPLWKQKAFLIPTLILAVALIFIAIFFVWNRTLRKQVNSHIGAFKESERNFKDIANNTPVGLIIADKKGNLLYANKRFSEITGYNVKELRGKNGFDLLTREQDREKYKEMMQKRILDQNKDVSSQYERIIVRKDGKEVQTEFFTTMTRWKGMDCPMALVQDITHRKQVEENLREKTITLNNILKSASDMAIITTSLDFHITYFNPIAERLYGYNARDVIGKTVQELYTVEDVDPEQFDKAIIKVNEKGKYTYTLRQEIENRVRFIESRVSGIFDSDEILIGYSIFSKDITERKQSEAELKKSRDEYKLIIENINEVFYRTDINGNLIIGSPSGPRLLGYDSTDQMIGLNIAKDLYAIPEERDEFLKLLSKNGKVSNYEVTLKKKDGTLILIIVNSHYYYDEEGNILGVEGFFTDITGRKKMENELRKSEERYHRIADATTDYIYTVHIDDDGKPAKTIHGVACKSVTGYSPEEFINNPHLWIQMIPEKDRDIVRDQTSRILSNNVPEPVEHRIIHKDGSIRWVKSSLVANRDNHGNLLSYDGLISDITERRKISEELEKTNKRLELAMDAGEHGFWDWDLDTNDVYFSPRYYTMLGYEPGELPMRLETWVDLLHPDDREATVSTVQEYVRKAQQYEVEFRLRTKDGGWRWISGKGKAFEKGSSGKPNRVVGVHVDITERKQIEIELKKSRNEYKLIIDNIDEVFYRTDTNGNVVMVSPSGAKLLGYYSADEMKGLNIANDFYAVPEERDESLKLLSKNGKVSNYKVTLKKKDGTLILIIVNSHYYYDAEGNILGVEGLFIDITERKSLEEREARAQRLETAGQIAGQVAHDFNNLLAPLTAYPELIREHLPKNHKALSYLGGIETAASRIADINQDLLTLGRRGYYKQGPLNLNEIIIQAIEGMGHLPDTLNCEIDLEEKLRNVNGGGAQIHRIFMNLLHNARDAIQDIGKIYIRSENYYVDEVSVIYGHVPKGEYVKLTVSDNGCGIPKDIADKIFDPFFSSKSTDRKKGSGLGLSVVQSVMQDHGGYIDLSTEVDKGTSFYLYFPVTYESIQETENDSYSGGNESILIVDNDEIHRDVSSELLKELGYNVTVTESGEKAIEILKENHQDLMVLDIEMLSGIDGVETYRRAVEINPSQKAIIVSGTSETKNVLEVQKMGAGAFIKKPITKISIATTVRRELDRKTRTKIEQQV
ncbi:MAG: PAS domain S-box protein [candidate division Zixibacteria bacterium]|nr:PAS domain S-box protein [candidate division Zixibacteria bacterium]